MVARQWSSSLLSCAERLLLKSVENAGNSFPTTQGKEPSSGSMRQKWGSPGCGRDSRASSGVDTGMSGSFLSFTKGVKDPLEVQRLGVISLETPLQKWASSRLEGRTSWIFSSCGRCARLATGTSWTRSGGLSKGQSPCEFLGGLLGFCSRRIRGLRSSVELVLEPEDSSPVLTWILGYFWSLPRGVSPRLEWVHARALSSRSSSSVALPFECIKGSVAFPRGFPTRLSHEAFPQGCPTCHCGVSRSSA